MEFKLNEFRDSSLKLLKDTMDKTVDLSQQGVEFIKDNHRKILFGGAAAILVLLAAALNEDDDSDESFGDSYSNGRDYDYDYDYDYDEDYEYSSNQSDYQDIINDEEETLVVSDNIKNNKHNYPKERKSPNCHMYHRDGKGYIRGGTDEEKQLFRELNNLTGQYICTECGIDFDEEDIDWSFSDEENGFYYCNFCSHSLEQAGIDAMDPDGFGYDEYGNWDQERLGF